MEGALTLSNGDTELLAKNVYGAVVGHLEVVDAGHNRRQVVVGCVWRFTRLTNDGEHGCKVLEAWLYVSLSCDITRMDTRRTSNWQLRTAGDELQEVPPLLVRKLAHRLEQVAHTLTVKVIAVVRLDRVHKSYKNVSVIMTVG
jgi:hypothetical protein